MEFLLHSYYVVANRECMVGFPEINHGRLPAAKGMRQAVRKLGLREAQILLYWGELVDAQKAHCARRIATLRRASGADPSAI